MQPCKYNTADDPGLMVFCSSPDALGDVRSSQTPEFWKSGRFPTVINRGKECLMFNIYTCAVCRHYKSV